MSDILVSEPTAESVVAPPKRTAETQSYQRILKSSALIGGSSLVNIGIGVFRTKVMAVLLGPAGIGLAGLYVSVSDIAQSVAGMGVNSSGVRQIAEAAGSNDQEQIARQAIVLRRMSLLLGLVGALSLLLFSGQLSKTTFGDDRHAKAIALLSLVVFFRLIAAGQGALINGMRRIADLARMNILSAAFGTVSGILLVYFFREEGIVASLIALAAMTVFTSWWFSRKIVLPTVRMTIRQTGREAAALLKLGFAFMASGLLTLGAAYLIRILILRQAGVEATGLYQSAWTLGGLYVGFILQAMGADFYPRLTAAAHDNPACNRMVNEQARIGLLLAGPGVIATLTIAPLVIESFYSVRFHGAVEILRWICLGATLQVISWPMGFILLAKAKQNLFIFSDLAWCVFYLGLAWAYIRSNGLNGAGMAFFGSYLFHSVMTYAIVHRVSGFRWSAENIRIGLAFCALIGFVFCSFYLMPHPWAICTGVIAATTSGIYSLKELCHLVQFERVPWFLRRRLMGSRVPAPGC